MWASLLAFAASAVAQSIVSTLAGIAGTIGSADGPAASSTFRLPEGVACLSSGAVVAADLSDGLLGRLRVVDAGVTSTISVTDSAGAPASISGIQGITVDASGSFFLSNVNHRILSMTPAYQVALLAGRGTAGFLDDTGAAAAFDAPAGLVAVGGVAYVADCNNHCIRAVAVAGGVVNTIAGGPGNPGSADGVGMAASFKRPRAVAAAGGFLYVADTENSLIRSVSLADFTVATLAGSIFSACSFADGLGTAAAFCAPKGLAADASGGVLFVSDADHFRMRRVVVASGETTTLAGGSAAGAANGAGAAASFGEPRGLCAAPGGALIVADRANSNIRAIAVATPSPTPSGSPSPTASGTRSPSPTASGTPSPSSSRSGTGSGTLSPTATRSPSPTASPQVCAPGSYLPPGAPSCAACPLGSVQPGWGAPGSCASCGGALRSNPNATRCIPCELMTRPDPSSPSCAPCRMGEWCDGNASTPLLCVPSDACLAYGAGLACKLGYEGPACARCAKSFFRASSGECASCDTVNFAAVLGITSPLWAVACAAILGCCFLAQRDFALHEQVRDAWSAYPQFLTVFFAHVARLVLLYRLSALPFPSAFFGFLAAVGQLGFSWEAIAACKADSWSFFDTWDLVVTAFFSVAAFILIADLCILQGFKIFIPEGKVYPIRSWRVFLFIDRFFPSFLQICWMAFAIAPDGKHLFYDPSTAPRLVYFVLSGVFIVAAAAFVVLRSCCLESRIETWAFKRVIVINGTKKTLLCAPRGKRYEAVWTTRLRLSRLLAIINRFASFFLAIAPLVAANSGAAQSVLWTMGWIGAQMVLSTFAVLSIALLIL